MTVTSYQNPILRGMYPDPSIVRVKDTFYMVNSTFEYHPGIALSKSTDLLNWTKMPGIAVSPAQADLREAKSNEGIFAVCIRYHEGHFYVITTNFAEFKNFIIRGTLSPDGNSIIWEQKRVVVDIMGIDPDLYFENGRTYVQFTGYIDDKGTKAIQQVEIELESGTILRGPEVISFGTGGRDVEGPHILHQKGYYYLLAAEGGTGLGHMITIFRSDNLWGPFEAAPQNPIFTNRDRASEPLQNIGHADLFQDQNDNWWLTCLGTRPASVGFVNYTNIGRETLLYPVNWSGDWPIIYNGIPTQTVDMTDFPAHTELLTKQKFPTFTDTFNNTQLNPEWMSLRDSLSERLEVGQGQLSLLGAAYALNDLATPSFLAVRQTEHEERFSIEVADTTQINSGAFGIATIINADHYCSLLVEQEQDGSLAIYKNIRVLDINLKEKVGTLQQLPTQLTLLNTKENKIFTAKTNTETISFSVNAMHFSNEAIAALNTGDMQGMYVLGDAKLVINRATRESMK